MRLPTAIPKRAENVRGGEKVTLLVDKKGVPEKDVLKTLRGGRRIHGLPDRAERGRESRIVSGGPGSRRGSESSREKGNRCQRVESEFAVKPHACEDLDIAESRITPRFRSAMDRENSCAPSELSPKMGRRGYTLQFS